MRRARAAIALFAAATGLACAASGGRELRPGTGSPEHGAARATTDRLPAPSDAILGSAPPPAARATRPPGESIQACVDRELAKRGLNAYGDVAATKYPNGPPVPPDSLERYDSVLRRFPEIRTACEASAPFH